MSEIDDGGPAFPTQEIRDGNGNGIVEAGRGVSVRDYFAARAPIDFRLAEDFRMKRTGNKKFTYEQVFVTMAAMRYSFADAMIAARSAPEGGDA